MSDKRLDPTSSTVRRLFAMSGNRCAYPGCSTPLYDIHHDAVLGEIAHIHGPTSDSPRWSKTVSNEECRSARNLVLLCPTHHSLIDQSTTVYTAEVLFAIKQQHEQIATPVTAMPPSIGERLLQRYRDAKSRVRYSLVRGGDFGWQAPDGTPARVYPDGQVVPMPEPEAERFLALRELAMEIGTIPATSPMRESRTDEFSRHNRAVKILQLMLKYPDTTFGELLDHAVTRSDPNSPEA